MSQEPNLKLDLTGKRRALLEILLREQDAANEAGKIRRRKIQSPAPLSFAQERLWFLDQSYPDSPLYNIPAALPIYGALDVNVVRATLNEIIRRHEILRTNFAAEDGRPMQIIAQGLELELPYFDLTNVNESERQQAFADLSDSENKRPFDLAREPLLRAVLVRMWDQVHYLSLTMHHIVSDAWSMQVFFKEFNVIYQSFLSGSSPSLSELSIQYADFAVWQREYLQGEELEKQLSYWRTQLEGVSTTVTTLPFDRPRPNYLSFKGVTLSFAFSRRASEKIWNLTKETGVTPFMLLLAGFKALLFRYTEQSSIVVGIPSANRNRTDLEGIIGFFVNSLVLHTKVSADLSFRQLIERVKEVILGAQAHQEVPFEKIVEELHPARDPNINPLFQIMFDFYNQPQSADDTSAPADKTEDEEEQIAIAPSTGTSKFDLSLSMGSNGRQFAGSIEYSVDLFDEATIRRMIGHFKTLLEAMTDAPDAAISRLSLMPEAERHLVLKEWNNTNEELPADICVHQHFERQVRLTPDAVAAVFRGKQLTYNELNGRANRLAHCLRRQGVGAETVVGICMNSSFELLTAIFGVLKAGGTYLPVDPRYPQDRISFMLENAGARVVLTQGELQENTTTLQSESLIVLDEDDSFLNRFSDENLEPVTIPRNSCYIIYTSGTTGRPKGVVVEHRSLMNLLHGMRAIRKIGPENRVLQFASPSFDASVCEVFETLLNGATLYLENRDLLIPGEPLVKFLQENDITVATMPPSVLAYLDESVLPGLQTVTVGGEPCPPGLVKQWDRQRMFFNGYGPTEITFASSFARCFADGSKPNIGKPMKNARYYVVDRNFEPCVINQIGELMIGGIGVARGYIGRSDLTAERFIPDPFSDEAGARLYRTGDLVRWLPDGTVDFIGRIDQQVKIRGFRIELGEIETVLNEHPHIAAAAVICSNGAVSFLDKELIAYVVGNTEESTSESLRDFLVTKLPEYMIPQVFVFLDEMPLTPIGKVDLNALPSPDAARRQKKYIAPKNPIEQILAEIWENVLNVERVGVHDNFFELGGHSLLVIQIVSRVRDNLYVELPIRKVFEFPTIAGLAAAMAEDPEMSSKIELIEQTLGRLNEFEDDEVERLLKTYSTNEKVEAEPESVPSIAPKKEESVNAQASTLFSPDRITRRKESGPAPLSFAQERLWFLDQFQPDSTTYNIYMPFTLNGSVNLSALDRSLNELARRHETLRTTFPVIDGLPMQVVAPEPNINLNVIDLRRLSAEEKQARAAEQVQKIVRSQFNLAEGPLMQTLLLNLSDEEHLLVLSMHHIISDGWSLRVFFSDFLALYEAYRKGEPSPLPELPVQYADFAVWQRERLQGETLEENLSFWRELLADIPLVLELPTDRQRPTIDSFHGAMETFAFPKQLSTSFEKICQEENATSFMALLAAFMVLLYRYTGQPKFAVGAPVANRNRAEIEGLIGFFTNTLVLPSNLSGNPTFRELLRRVREVTLGAYAHEDLPFERLVEELNPERNLNVNPLFQVMFILERVTGVFQVPSENASEQDEPSVGTAPNAKFDLTLYIEETPQGLIGGFEYARELFDKSTIQRLIKHFQMILELVAWNPDQHLFDLNILTPDERSRILTEWNDAAAVDLPFESVVTGFETQVEQTPDAVALEYGDKFFTYREVNEIANRLAAHLENLGVEPEDCVAVCMEPGADIVLAMLGVLKAGGVYLPLDANFPKERMSFILHDSQVKTLLTQESLIEKLPETDAHVLPFELDAAWLAGERAENPPLKISADNSAYVIYTSGSTGTPKGVVLPHRTLVGLIAWELDDPKLVAGNRTAQFSSLVFDVSLQEIFFAWCSGGTLVCLTENRADFPRVLNFLAEKSIQTLFLPYVALQQLAEAAADRNLNERFALREVITAGEQLKVSPQIVNWFSQMKDCKLLNQYGPSETHIISNYTLGELPVEWEQLPPIGKPVAGARFYALDGSGQPVPAGVAGELYIGGTCLARGYLNRPALTAEKFLPDPFGKEPGARMYRSGDLVKFHPDGNMEFLGRIDHQLKIRGFRVELGEIEACLMGHPDVAEAAVTVRDSDSGERQLIGYVMPDPGASPGAAELRQFLLEKLPDYMVPSFFVVLESLSLTATGKLDRLSLPEPENARPDLEPQFVAPRSQFEQQIAAIWEELIGISGIGINDNFFELGGHSLLATKLISRIRDQFGVEISLRSFFGGPTIAELSLVVVQAQLALINEQDQSALLHSVEELTDEAIEELLSTEAVDAA